MVAVNVYVIKLGGTSITVVGNCHRIKYTLAVNVYVIKLGGTSTTVAVTCRTVGISDYSGRHLPHGANHT